MNRFSVHLEDRQRQAIDDMVRESKQTNPPLDLSQAEVIRRLVDRGIEESDELRDLVDDASLILLRREQFKDRDGQLRNLRTGFQPRVLGHFKKRFKNGTPPEQIIEFAYNMREDARLLWPDDLAPEDPNDAEAYRERRRELIDWIDELVDAYIDAYQDSTYDPLDPDEAFAHFGKVEEGRERRELEEKGVDLEARARQLADVADTPQTDAIATALAKHEGVGRQTALEAAEAALEDKGGVPADD